MLWACVLLPHLALDGIRRRQPTPTPAPEAIDPAHSARCQQLLAAWAYRYSSQVSTCFPDAVLIEAEGSLGLFGPWPRFEAQLRADLAALGFRHRIALAPTASAARVLAGHADGVAITTLETMQRALAHVPVAQARLPEAAAVAF